METGYQHGSDMLVGIVTGENTFTPLGHSKTCTITNSAETKERAVKPTLTEKATADNPGMWKEKSVSGLSVSISAEGFKFYGDELDPGDDDASYTISMENSGQVELKLIPAEK